MRERSPSARDAICRTDRGPDAALTKTTASGSRTTRERPRGSAEAPGAAQTARTHVSPSVHDDGDAHECAAWLDAPHPSVVAINAAKVWLRIVVIEHLAESHGRALDRDPACERVQRPVEQIAHARDAVPTHVPNSILARNPNASKIA
ncbi:MAG: hypothetical protein ACHREM_15130 [Polyangiales bacterium]